MKNAYLVLGMFVSTVFATAADVTVSQYAHPVKVTAATVTAEGHGFPSYRVIATATFGNSCEVPRESEVVKLVEYKNGFNTLSITLAEINNNRVCPAVYKPVQRTFDLGIYTKPNDGSFNAILVNGKKAVALRNE